MAKKFLTGIDLTNNKAINMASPSSANDGANKAYVDSFQAGLEYKAEARVATTTNGTLATAYANGSTVDGIALVTGDRILIKNQTSAIDNGIYTVNASGAPTRAVDANTTASLDNATLFVLSGTVNAGTMWTQTTINPTVGSSNIVFAAFAPGIIYTASNGLQLVGGAFSVLLDANPGLQSIGTGLKAVAGQGILVSGGIAIDTSLVVRKFAINVGDGASTVIAVTHNLGTFDVTVGLYEISSGIEVETDLVHTSTNVVTFTFATAPTAGQYRAVVHG